jgi:dipeptidyl aminopeptidase/acylaminoacyl peptidase
MRPAGLWIWEGDGARPVWEPECSLPLRDFELVAWTSFDGAVVPGWFAVPEGAAPAAGWPAVVWVHGGPAMQARAHFRPDMQALLAQGYAVLMPNVRGSTGYGRVTMDADDVEKRLDSVHDLAAGREWLARRSEIDPERIAVMGQSYGGYMVLAALTEYPALWRCGIDFYGIADFGTLLEGTGPWRRGHRAAEYGDPSRHRALFDRISPIRHVDRVRVPLLVLHGERDPRVGIGESEQVVAALRARGRPVVYETFGYAGHGFIRPDDTVRVYAAVRDFLAAHL